MTDRERRELSSGIPDQGMSHGIDLVHWFVGERYPRPVVAHGKRQRRNREVRRFMWLISWRQS